MAQRALLVLFLATAGCGSTAEDRDTPPGVGMQCLAASENLSTFGSFALNEINIEDDPADPVVCLNHHFQGRVSCPYGQTEADMALPDTDPRRCRTPGGELVTTKVLPQLTGRPPADAIVQTCRCEGPDPDATYCKCPATMTCTHVIDNLGGLNTQYAGSYCIHPGTEYVQDTDYGPECDRLAAPGTPGHCG